MKYIIPQFLALVFSFSIAMAQQMPSHKQWSDLLVKHVDPYGKVNYKGFKTDEVLLDEYLELLKNNHPQGNWPVDAQKAYWINAYNAFTVKLVLNNYPVQSIMEIKDGDKDAWHIPFIELGGKLYTLDYIEHTMLRAQFSDSRIHFAVNCTAISCPPLLNKAFTKDNLNIELRLATRRFINDNRYNILSENRLQLSQIFEWYKEDFLKEEASIQEYVDKNTPHLNVSTNASLTFMKYNWALNEKK